MSTLLTVGDHLDLLEREGELLATRAAAAGVARAVPSTPGWTVRDLLAHQGEVHRWAADVLTARWDQRSDHSKDERVRAPEAVLDWYRAGLAEVLAAVRSAPDDVSALVFLLDAPPPRAFWARRQAHETTIHGVDALAAELGRLPTATEVGIGEAAAADGIDELVHGFLPRKRSRLRSPEPYTLAIEPSDVDRRWVLTISPDPLVTKESSEPADAAFTGTAAELYLGLWNRGDEVTGPVEVLEQWRAQARVSWI